MVGSRKIKAAAHHRLKAALSCRRSQGGMVGSRKVKVAALSEALSRRSEEGVDACREQ
jgi:hypothetical protein